MQGGKDEHSHGSASESQTHGFLVAHFTDKDDVGVGARMAPRRALAKLFVSDRFRAGQLWTACWMHELDRSRW